MKEKTNDLSQRLLDYGIEIVKLSTGLEKTFTGRHFAKQLLRSGTSIGANYEEACGAQRKADFIHKLQIVLKEARESLYWLRLIQSSEILKGQTLDMLISETKQLSNIIAKSIITTKAGL
jgi:four helix bundle protein